MLDRERGGRSHYLHRLDGNGQFDGAIVVGQFSLSWAQVSMGNSAVHGMDLIKYLGGQFDEQLGNQAATATRRMSDCCAGMRLPWTNSRLVFGRLQVVYQLQANLGRRRRSLLFLHSSC
jgi:hypothetical protein